MTSSANGGKQAFVTVGTTKFDALIQALDSDACLKALRKRGFTRVLMQIGHGTHVPRAKIDAIPDMRIEHYRHNPQYKKDVEAADLIISHAGAGSIMDALSARKKLLVVVNTLLMDNHQTEVADAMAENQYCVATSCEKLLLALEEANFDALHEYPQPDEAAFPALVDELMLGSASDKTQTNFHTGVTMDEEQAMDDQRALQESSTRSDGMRFGRTRVLCKCSAELGMFPSTCHVGPHWGCMLVTYAIAIAPVGFLFTHNRVHTGLRIALIVSVVITTVVFSFVACSDPGIVYKSYNPAPSAADQGVVCAQCQIRRPEDASHCFDCNVCIHELDHHCPWTGKCIGKRTLYWFYAFLGAMTCHLVLVAIAISMLILHT
ncbi:TPA: hypothetical protein N0F65_007997 [Lagenidium giganteum]|uniref:Palmitoyltransferase n=1 Tax=Lagenidium giganteum TaxID=4803 RepID=A0AAV2YNW4_9STRA|nr:TPA: hypothetical protein N0F65_007997 [Lagenidium giganteum]